MSCTIQIRNAREFSLHIWGCLISKLSTIRKPWWGGQVTYGIDNVRRMIGDDRADLHLGFRSSWNRTWRGAVLQEQHSLSKPRPGESTSWVQVPHGTLHPGLSPVAKSSGQAAAPVMSATLPRLRTGTQCQSEAAV
jgi:hypothetical protein